MWVFVMANTEELRDIIGYTCSRHWTTNNERRYSLDCNACEYDKKRVTAIQAYVDRLVIEAVASITHLIARAVEEAEGNAMAYMTPDRRQDYKNHRDGSFQNDPRLERARLAELNGNNMKGVHG